MKPFPTLSMIPPIPKCDFWQCGGYSQENLLGLLPGQTWPCILLPRVLLCLLYSISDLSACSIISYSYTLHSTLYPASHPVSVPSYSTVNRVILQYIRLVISFYIQLSVNLVILQYILHVYVQFLFQAIP